MELLLFSEKPPPSYSSLTTNEYIVIDMDSQPRNPNQIPLTVRSNENLPDQTSIENTTAGDQPQPVTGTTDGNRPSPVTGQGDAPGIVTSAVASVVAEHNRYTPEYRVDRELVVSYYEEIMKYLHLYGPEGATVLGSALYVLILAGTQGREVWAVGSVRRNMSSGLLLGLALKIRLDKPKFGISLTKDIIEAPNNIRLEGRMLRKIVISAFLYRVLAQFLFLFTVFLSAAVTLILELWGSGAEINKSFRW